jgi:hypothetical protein
MTTFQHINARMHNLPRVDELIVSWDDFIVILFTRSGVREVTKVT